MRNINLLYAVIIGCGWWSYVDYYSLHIFKDPNHGLFLRIKGVVEHVIRVRLEIELSFLHPVYSLKQIHTCGQTITFKFTNLWVVRKERERERESTDFLNKTKHTLSAQSLTILCFSNAIFRACLALARLGE